MSIVKVIADIFNNKVFLPLFLSLLPNIINCSDFTKQLPIFKYVCVVTLNQVLRKGQGQKVFNVNPCLNLFSLPLFRTGSISGVWYGCCWFALKLAAIAKLFFRTNINPMALKNTLCSKMSDSTFSNWNGHISIFICDKVLFSTVLFKVSLRLYSSFIH